MKLTKKKLEMINAFSWRFYNTFKSVILPVALPFILSQMQKTPNSFEFVTNKEFWVALAYAIVISVLGSTIAGIDKLRRVE